MDKRYISFDIEASGSTPGKYSMLSLGACVVGDTSQHFYREIQPINRNCIPQAMQVCAKGFRSLDDVRHLKEFDPDSEQFDPYKVLDVLSEKGETPQKVMRDYAEWINEVTEGYEPVAAAAPIKFDGMFTCWYFDNFYEGENPFGHRGEDMNSYYRGVKGDRFASLKYMGLRDEEGLPHNALEDAIQQAHEFEAILAMLRRKE